MKSCPFCHEVIFDDDKCPSCGKIIVEKTTTTSNLSKKPLKPKKKHLDAFMAKTKTHLPKIFSFRNTLVYLIIIIFAILFYWHDLRPAIIRANCLKQDGGVAGYYYDDCLYRHGLN
jgi:uncharacterized membrane protein YvbJ